MINLLLKLKNFYLNFKKNYYSIVIIESKQIYFRHQKISYKEQNLLGLIQNALSAVWLLLLFSILLKDIIYIYLMFFIFLFCFVLYVFVIYFPALVPKKILSSIIGLSYFYKSESKISNIFIYAVFLLLLLLNIGFDVKTYVLIRLLFFFRCFLAFVFFFYQASPKMQMSILKNSLILDLQLLNELHPMELIALDDFILLNLKNNKVNATEVEAIMSKYEELQKKGIKHVTISYERKIENDQIVIYDYENIIEGVNIIIDKIEKYKNILKK